MRTPSFRKGLTASWRGIVSGSWLCRPSVRITMILRFPERVPPLVENIWVAANANALSRRVRPFVCGTRSTALSNCVASALSRKLTSTWASLLYDIRPSWWSSMEGSNAEARTLMKSFCLTKFSSLMLPDVSTTKATSVSSEHFTTEKTRGKMEDEELRN